MKTITINIPSSIIEIVAAVLTALGSIAASAAGVLPEKYAGLFSAVAGAALIISRGLAKYEYSGTVVSVPAQTEAPATLAAAALPAAADPSSPVIVEQPAAPAAADPILKV